MNVTSVFPLVLPLIGVLIGAAASFSTQVFFYRRARRRDQKRTAAILAQTLDFFAEECCEAIMRADLHNSSRGHAGGRSAVVPDLPKVIDGTDLSDLTPRILSEYLALQMKVRLADRKIGFWWDIGEREDAPEEAYEQAALLGYDAIQLARQMRKAAHLPEPNYSHYYYDIENALSEPRKRALETLAQRKPEVS